ncbi:alanine:cation symporter family protein [Prevotella scopos JCM 17725]|uniref:Alanine or glycine:cation symporter, AGCS family n=1 Tax=Prevotella scopos JCM 17725 TaxID=1236518 RepID=A0AAX2F782_9BACT|nr:alanine/glycine:cation symporter family protein [Prevotella scopos]ANR73940.1 sodium:alanine symporter [Prevotella scopos JCM 17725]QUB44529.1 alanine:cation symporter family protein [Prevotella scopos JCM 17725]SHG12413.1 alanine or glycine:cation symporter, AGCS family [Prevotella scopos JCM 17725]
MIDLFSANGWLNTSIVFVNDFVWSYILVGCLIVCALWFTWRTHFVQFRMVGEMVRLLGESTGTHDKGEKHVSSFQAFAVSIASRVGTGNLAGVASAIAIGGPGAVFWMWIIALLGAATAFIESTLAQLYKRRHADSFIGGPAYYILHGMHCKWMAKLFAVLITLTFCMAYISIQSNTICGAMDKAFSIAPIWMGVVLAVLSLVIVFGGIQRIAKVSSILVPLMAVGYVLLALVIIIMNIQLIPSVFRLIIENAFGFEQIAGGGLGATMMNGIKRGLFSNEAGEGSAPNVAATASTTHPVKQGLIQSLGVFTDTLLVCSCTAFVIIISGLYVNSTDSGIKLTQIALESEVGTAGPIFIAIAIFFFAFSSIIGNYYYGEANVRFLTQNPSAILVLRVITGGVMVMFGAIASLDLVWSIGDFFMALITICNLIAILTLGKYAFRLLDNYRQQKCAGIKSPVFKRDMMPDIEKDIECWG